MNIQITVLQNGQAQLALQNLLPAPAATATAALPQQFVLLNFDLRKTDSNDLEGVFTLRDRRLPTGQPADFQKLSPREQEILLALASGLSYKMAAAELTISIETVRTHVKRIYEKLHVHSLAEATAKMFF